MDQNFSLHCLDMMSNIKHGAYFDFCHLMGVFFYYSIAQTSLV